MNNKTSKIEVLAPCGSYEILVAAVHAGADACYIGGNSFGARAYATNFDQDTIQKAVTYAHLHGVKVYLTVNTLLKQAELPALYDYIKPFYEIGGDALIIQDLGVFSYVKKQFPDIAIHCSTQMNITSAYGAALMKAQGASRVVTAREMSLAEIRTIKEQVDIEVETFVHGAMCYSYSGQCLMSSLAGGRSGNRGRCAQPCRKCYNNSYLLSMKDMCALSLIPELIEAGIDSLKIEGRMKNAYYVASTVHAYRTIVDDYLQGKFDKKKAEDLTFELANIYNRGGFSDGYFFRHNGADMISKTRPNNQGVAVGRLERIENGTITLKLTEAVFRQDVLELSTKSGEIVEITSSKEENAGQYLTLNCPKTKQLQKEQLVYRTKCPKILQHVQEDYIDQYKKLPITIAVSARIGEPLSASISLKLNSKTYTATLTDMQVEPSRQGETSEDAIKKPFAQLGNTEYALETFQCTFDSNAFLPNGVLKKLRRSLLTALETIIEKTHARVAPVELPWDSVYEMYTSVKDTDISEVAGDTLILGISTMDQLYVTLEELPHMASNVTGITIPVSMYDQCRDMVPDSIRIYVELPHIIHDNSSLDLQESGIRGIYIRNIDALAIITSQTLPEDCHILCDASLYCYNRLAHGFIRQFFGGRMVTFLTPRELKLEELDDISNEALCLTLYEYQPVMLTANCLQKTQYGCKKEDTVLAVTDEMGNRFYAGTNCQMCYNVIYNKVPYSILDKYKTPAFSRLHSKGYMVHFTIEPETRVRQILRTFAGDTADIGEKTSGHLYRGVL